MDSAEHDPVRSEPTAHPVNYWANLAQSASLDVNLRFGHHLMRLPGTWIGSLHAPVGTPESTLAPAAVTGSGTSLKHKITRAVRMPLTEWHYWWQAHYLDAILDDGFHQLERGSRHQARKHLRRGQQLLRGILIRNFARFPNYFYDDMAWLVLASQRLNDLSLRLNARPAMLASFAMHSLGQQLHRGQDAVLGGGLYWSRSRDFKNTPSNGPAALYFARAGDVHTASELLDWLHGNLFDPQTGLYLDGLRLSTSGTNLVKDIYSYNQGTVLGALLAVGHPSHLAQASELITAIRTHLADPNYQLQFGSGGDGNLFTGILCRYLAVAARDQRLPAEARATAAHLVRATAQAVLKQDETQLSAAIQRWTILHAAHSCAA